MSKTDHLGAKNIGGNPEKGRREMDFYPTPEDVTTALLDFLGWKNSTIWEPAAGDGAMVRVLERYGNRVIATDIRTTGDDYLATPVPDGVQAIVTNPPFSAAESFIRRSLENGLPFALLLKSQYWHAGSRRALFFRSPPSLVLPLTWRPDFTGQGASLMDVAWSVWLTPNMRTRTEYVPLERPADPGQVSIFGGTA
ncbi:MAG: SAM-dependent DNA methyltransferase [Clostridia bacterium]|nr:SAM-dependent DNA methyltransferase [Clostridia bacterium]